MCAARTQIRNGKCLLCIIVPAIIDVCRAQPAHSQVARFRLNGQPLQVPQEGHTKPSSQRCSARQCEHASSPENLVSNAGRDMGVSFFHLAGMGRTIPRTLQIGKPRRTTSCAAGSKGISLSRGLVGGHAFRQHSRELVLSRFISGLFRAMFAMKEIWNGKEIHS